jgi:hypothetical protein
MIAALLLAVGAGAALQVTFLLDQAQQLADGQRTLQLELSQFDARAADLASAQAAYVAPGQPDAPWIDRVNTVSADLTTSLAAIRASAHVDDAPVKLQAISDALLQASAADTAAREYLRQDLDLPAADTVFGEGRGSINAARATAADLSSAESAWFDRERSRLQQRMLLIAGGAAAILLIGLLFLTPLPRPRPQPAEPAVVEPPAPLPVAEERPASVPTIDLGAAAELCTALSRVDSSAALPDVLARAAALLDASGVIVWLASGNELVAATAHGYSPQVINRLGAIPHDADNATAAAWRTGEVRTVVGDVMSNGAVVAPMFAPDTCIGVLAAEVRHGREQDASTRAVTMMVAAQLATILAAWPTPVAGGS